MQDTTQATTLRTHWSRCLMLCSVFHDTKNSSPVSSFHIQLHSLYPRDYIIISCLDFLSFIYYYLAFILLWCKNYQYDSSLMGSPSRAVDFERSGRSTRGPRPKSCCRTDKLGRILTWKPHLCIHVDIKHQKLIYSRGGRDLKAVIEFYSILCSTLYSPILASWFSEWIP